MRFSECKWHNRNTYINEKWKKILKVTVDYRSKERLAKNFAAPSGLLKISCIFQGYGGREDIEESLLQIRL